MLSQEFSHFATELLHDGPILLPRHLLLSAAKSAHKPHTPFKHPVPAHRELNLPHLYLAIIPSGCKMSMTHIL
jgi:hypothetical protein